MNGQMSLFDIPGNETLAPEMWECMKSCVNYGKYVDWFPIREDGRRCMYGVHMDGTSGDDIIQEVGADQRVHFWCRYYRQKEKNNGR